MVSFHLRGCGFCVAVRRVEPRVLLHTVSSSSIMALFSFSSPSPPPTLSGDEVAEKFLHSRDGIRKGAWMIWTLSLFSKRDAMRGAIKRRQNDNNSAAETDCTFAFILLFAAAVTMLRECSSYPVLHTGAGSYPWVCYTCFRSKGQKREDSLTVMNHPKLMVQN